MGHDSESGELLMPAGPEQLHATVAMVLVRDWPEIVVPTQAEISLFCEMLKLSVSTSIADALTDTSLKAII